MQHKPLLVLIDDDTDDHEIFSMALEEIEEPFSILNFMDCESALQHFSIGDVQQPDFVFVDINYPESAGDNVWSDCKPSGSSITPRLSSTRQAYLKNGRRNLKPLG